MAALALAVATGSLAAEPQPSFQCEIKDGGKVAISATKRGLAFNGELAAQAA